MYVISLSLWLLTIVCDCSGQGGSGGQFFLCFYPEIIMRHCQFKPRRWGAPTVVEKECTGVGARDSAYQKIYSSVLLPRQTCLGTYMLRRQLSRLRGHPRCSVFLFCHFNFNFNLFSASTNSVGWLAIETRKSGARPHIRPSWSSRFVTWYIYFCKYVHQLQYFYQLMS